VRRHWRTAADELLDQNEAHEWVEGGTAIGPRKRDADPSALSQLATEFWIRANPGAQLHIRGNHRIILFKKFTHILPKRFGLLWQLRNPKLMQNVRHIYALSSEVESIAVPK